MNKGLTLVICAGEYGGFYFRKSLKEYPKSMRLCAGWIAITLYFYDREVATFKLIQSLKSQN